MRNKTLLVSIILVLSAFLSACSGVAAAQAIQTPTEPAAVAASPAERTISITGSGKAVLTPDIAYIYLGVNTQATDAKKAVSDNNTESAAVVNALKSAGIASKDIQTTNFSIMPQQQYDKDGNLTGILYVVDNTVYVTVRDLSKIGDLLDAAVKAGANNVNSISFDVADRAAALSQARKAAMDDAKNQASELAQAAGVTLGDVQSISINSNPTPIPYFASAKAAGNAVAAAPSVSVEPGQLTITVDVSVVYNIR